MTLEQRQIRIERLTLVGLLALAAALLAEAIRSTAVHLDWLAATDAAARALQVVWIVGLVAFGLAFTVLFLLGRQLPDQERRVLGDEYQVLLSRESAVAAFAVTFVVAVVIAAIPASDQLPGNAVAAALAGLGAATLALRRLWA